MTEKTSAEQLRAAATKLRANPEHPVDEPLAALLDDAAARLEFFARFSEKALPTVQYELAEARVILGGDRG